jgi:hypothetical protein
MAFKGLTQQDAIKRIAGLRCTFHPSLFNVTLAQRTCGAIHVPAIVTVLVILDVHPAALPASPRNQTTGHAQP